jgi:hypothetical protein
MMLFLDTCDLKVHVPRLIPVEPLPFMVFFMVARKTMDAGRLFNYCNLLPNT